MKPEQKMLIEHSCARLINAFAIYNDAGRFEELVSLFTPDGRFARPTAPDNFTEGRENILAAFRARPKERVGRHVMTNIQIEVIDETSARGLCYATLYTGSADKPAADFGLQANAAQFIGEVYTDFALTDEGWKIARQTGKIIFTT